MEKRIYKKIYLLLNQDLKVRRIKQLIKEYYGVSIKESDILKWFPIKRNHNEYNPLEKRLILNLHLKSTCSIQKLIQYLSSYHGIETSESSIRTLASRAGVKKKKVQIEKVSKSFNLNSINTPHKAYFLGLLMTDGVVDSPPTQRASITVNDEDAIQFLANHIGIPYRPVHQAGRDTSYTLTLHGKEVVDALAKYGITSRKSLTLNPSRELLENEYLPYILRGVIDGDGNIRRDGSRMSIYSASKDFIDWCVEAFVTLGFNEPKVQMRYEEDNSKNTMYILDTASKHNMELLKETVYREPFGMARKYNYLSQERRSETIIETA